MDCGTKGVGMSEDYLLTKYAHIPDEEIAQDLKDTQVELWNLEKLLNDPMDPRITERKSFITLLENIQEARKKAQGNDIDH
jgi:hypothetical protein